METSQNMAAAEEPAGSNHVTPTNPTEKEGEKSAKEDLFGDWLVVSKSRKPTKSSSKIQGADKGINKETTKEAIVQRNRNRYVALYEKAPVSNGKQLFQEGTKENQEDCKRDTPKIWTKKKETKKGASVTSAPKGGPGCQLCEGYGEIRRCLQAWRGAECPTIPLAHAHGIKTTMHVEVISPNHLRFVDEPRPPDPNVVQRKPENEELHEGGVSPMQEGESNDDDENEVEMVTETAPT
ncbi:hypothetical protein SESBI_12435 [Sesbania bispinosa]|nr:hypothetical protein SESBI_12435 [Sesbania bispinosa]